MPGPDSTSTTDAAESCTERSDTSNLDAADALEQAPGQGELHAASPAENLHSNQPNESTVNANLCDWDGSERNAPPPDKGTSNTPAEPVNDQSAQTPTETGATGESLHDSSPTCPDGTPPLPSLDSMGNAYTGCIDQLSPQEWDIAGKALTENPFGSLISALASIAENVQSWFSGEETNPRDSYNAVKAGGEIGEMVGGPMKGAAASIGARGGTTSESSRPQQQTSSR